MDIQPDTDRTTAVPAARTGRGRRRRRHLLLPLAMVAASLVAVPGTASAADLPSTFVITGSGFGHGVGMAQYGAYEMSRQGATSTEILHHYYRGTTVPNVTTPRTVDVQVHGPDPYDFDGYGDTGSTTVTVHDGAWRLLADGDFVAAGKATDIAVSAQDGAVVVKFSGRTIKRQQLMLQWAGTSYFRPDASPATISVDGAHGTYRHGRVLLSASEGTANVVNRLRLNSEYLWGLAEMPSSWGATGGGSALRAQAIVARSYAMLKAADWKRTCRCHVVDDVRDQYFSGWSKESGPYGSHWVKAVNATDSTISTARVLAYAGRPVEAHYYSSSGGRTANSEDVWVSVIPYERSVADPYSKVAPGNDYARWRRVMGQSGAQDLFGLDRVASIRVTDRYSSGQARTLVATSPSGRTASVTGPADRIRAVVGSHTRPGNVPSSWITGIRAD